MVESIEIFKCLADGSRLKIIQGLMKESMYVELIAQRLALTPSTVCVHLKKLEAAGLVSAKKDQYYTVYSINAELLEATIATLVAPAYDELNQEAQREAAYRAKVLDNFFEYGKLKNIPAQRKKRVIILEQIVSKFEYDKDYPEREVNLIIADMHDDFCTLRRELIEEGLMNRDHGIYCRVRKT